MMLIPIRRALGATAVTALAFTSAASHAFLNYQSGERAKSARSEYQPAVASVDIASLFNDLPKSTRALSLQLPSGKRFEVSRTRVLNGLDGGRTFVGYFNSHGDDYRVFVTEQGGVVSGILRSPEGLIDLQPTASGRAGEVSVFAHARAGSQKAFSFRPDAKHPPEALAVISRQESLRASGATLGISTQQLEAAKDRAKAGPTTIDLLVGYTPGMTARHSSAAGVLARINTLVATMNTALTDSQVALTIRLVHAAQVSYSDTGSNDSALDAISPGSTNALKATIDGLRNQYGADLVALLRPYHQATHQGCGIAWILGANGNGIQSFDTQYAFSAISDGADTGGSGYFCEPITFAHEIGHNLGLLHDRANASGIGITNYAFGYIDNAVGFGTIMSYSSNRVGKYSNPNVICLNNAPCGKPAGASDSANNAAAIAVGMNAIAGFRAAAALTSDTDADGIPDVIEASVGRLASQKDNDVFSLSQLFVMQQYRDFLSREADLTGLTHWMSLLNGGTQSREQVIQNFFASAEFQNTVSPIVRLYLGFFNRIPDHAGLWGWVNLYRSGQSLNSISAAFASSAEITATYGALTNAQFVTLVYQNVLGRAPDPSGYTNWLNLLNAGMSRGELMVGFTESQEHRNRSANSVFVIMTYEGMLRRAAEPSGYQHWLNYLAQGNSQLNLTREFLNVPEYRRRFLPS